MEVVTWAYNSSEAQIRVLRSEANSAPREQRLQSENGYTLQFRTQLNNRTIENAAGRILHFRTP